MRDNECLLSQTWLAASVIATGTNAPALDLDVYISLVAFLAVLWATCLAVGVLLGGLGLPFFAHNLDKEQAAMKGAWLCC
jgi:hypothetical protein